MIGVTELSTRLQAASDEAALTTLGFHEDDRADVRLAIEAELADPERMAEIETLAERLRANIGAIDAAGDSLDHEAAASEWRGIGVLPLLALLAVADDVREYHRSRGISEEVSNHSLSDLGQQAWVHRRTFGAFGLHTYGWMSTAFSGNLYWLGRLQFNLVQHEGVWMLSTHIPEIGPLTPDLVDDAFRQAAAFFAEHFADYPTELFFCGSWLLDPQLVEVLKPESNMVKFQQRWNLVKDLGEADADAVFFVFRRRGDVDRSTLPQETSLQRAIVTKLSSGGHWHAWGGTVEQAPYL